ncbi:MAG TPA: BlaI/MecI/CopY family transcriptional regulator [Candidatus Acidoferrales bacterium]|nr:BlaI/MecI/CopY family transcriptional regulator [Candidatus Acidoferrales bacterium]
MAGGRKKRSLSLTPLELQIMQVLWREGAGDVLHVQKNLPSGTNLAYTTVQTMLNVLQRKGRVRRKLKGRAYEYRPVLSEEKAVRHAVRDLVKRLFGGSSEELVMSLVKTRQIDPARMVALTKKILAQEEEKENE